MNENKKRFVASALSLIFAMSFLTTNVFASPNGDPQGDPPGGSAMGDPPDGGPMGDPPGDPPDGMGGGSASASYTGAAKARISTAQTQPCWSITERRSTSRAAASPRTALMPTAYSPTAQA